MALQVQVRPPFSASSSRSAPSWTPNHSHVCLSGGDHRSSFSWSVLGGGEKRRGKIGGETVTVRSSLDAAGPVVAVGQVTEVTKETFWPLVKAAGDKTVVLDMYTQWCGPCKVMAPKFQELSKKYLDVVFLKIDCNNENRPLAKELGLRVVPTFKILKDSTIVKEVTGTKVDDLVVAIESVS